MSKKTVRQNSNSTITTLLTQGLQDEYVSVYYHEVSSIMRGFGDAEIKYQHQASVILVEKIVHSQLKGILQEVIDHAVSLRGKPLIKQKDFEFLMRKNPTKIFRLKKYLKDLQFFKKHIRSLVSDSSKVLPLDEDGSFDLSDEESEMEISEKFDEEKTRRIFRADRISQITVGAQGYQEYNEARRTSFFCRNSTVLQSRMREFLRVPAEVILTQRIMTILAFLANETVATLVDYCILSRLNSSNRLKDAHSRVTSSGTSYQMLHLCPEVAQGRGLDGIKPITVQEIHEAMRRHCQQSAKKLGLQRRNTVNPKQPFLAI